MIAQTPNEKKNSRTVFTSTEVTIAIVDVEMTYDYAEIERMLRKRRSDDCNEKLNRVVNADHARREYRHGLNTQARILAWRNPGLVYISKARCKHRRIKRSSAKG
jgi:hypothetical protein